MVHQGEQQGADADAREEHVVVDIREEEALVFVSTAHQVSDGKQHDGDHKRDRADLGKLTHEGVVLPELLGSYSM